MKKTFNWIKRVVQRFLKNNCGMHAAGLTYFSLLAVVPVLCCILVAAKACDVDDYARTQINAKIDSLIVEIEKGQDEDVPFLAATDAKEREKKRIAASEFAHQARVLSNELFGRVDQFNVGTLGWVGFGFLLWTVISSLASVETSFNGIFGVAKARPIWKRAYLYLFIMIALPILVTVAMSLPILNVVKNVLTATMGHLWLTKWVSDGLIGLLDSRLFRFAFTLAVSTLDFCFFFWVIPNCRVKFRCACLGGLITAVLFGGWLKVCAVAQVGIAKSSALYGSFAFLPIVLAWLYMSWQIVLVGACMVREFESDPQQQ
jgi:YihY family inner membrane protein